MELWWLATTVMRYPSQVYRDYWWAVILQKLFWYAIPMLLVAGGIEGFFSATNSPLVMKFSLAAVLFALLLMWLLPHRGSAARADSGL